MLADLDADEREIKHIVHKIENDSSVRSPIAYLRTALANGDGPELIAQARRELAAADPERSDYRMDRKLGVTHGTCPGCQDIYPVPEDGHVPAHDDPVLDGKCHGSGKRAIEWIRPATVPPEVTEDG